MAGRIMDREPVLHIYPLTTEHGDARIVGNHSALTLLRDAIDAALEQGQVSCSPFAADGEGYDLELIMQPGNCHSEEWLEMDEPYFDWRSNGG